MFQLAQVATRDLSATRALLQAGLDKVAANFPIARRIKSIVIAENDEETLKDSSSARARDPSEI
jgi:hypothetical protein